MHALRSSVLLLSSLLFLACGAEPQEDWANGSLKVSATIEPDPPRVGQNTMHIQVTDASGQPLTGATLTVDPQMPAHGHGSTEQATVTDEGGGAYRAWPVTFQMPGHWEVTLRASHGTEKGQQLVSYEVN